MGLMVLLVSAAIVATVQLTVPDPGTAASAATRGGAAGLLLVQRAVSEGSPHTLTDTERTEMADIIRRKEDTAIKEAEARIRAKMSKMHEHQRPLSAPVSDPRNAALSGKVSKRTLPKFRPTRLESDMWSYGE